MEKSDSLLNSPQPPRDLQRFYRRDDAKTHFMEGEQEKNELDELQPACSVEDPSKPSLAFLPIEMIDAIFSFVDGESLLISSSVCRLFRKLSEENKFWYQHCMAGKRHIFWISKQDYSRPLKYDWKEVWLWYQRVDSHKFQAEDKKTGHGTDTTDQGCYRGEFKDNKKEGKGIHVWTDNSRYEGEWKTDKRNGFGTYYWPDGRRFEGEHMNDKRSHGIFYWPEGSIYEGDYRESHRDGRGKFIWPDGDSFEGEWKKGGRFGTGIFTCVQKGQEGLYSQENWAEENFEFGEKGSRNKRQDIEPPTKKRPLDNSKPKKKKKRTRK